VLAGDGPEADWIRARSEELGIAEDVVLLGPVSHDATRHLYRSCSLLCLPSAGEPFGMVVLEAMASGRAVVAVDAGGPRWLVEDGVGGLLMSGGSVTELERVLRDALGQPGRLEEMGRRNRERVERELSLTRLVHVLEEEYRSRPEAAFRRAVVGAAS
jgi:glycosyltransferase involved in cell wall biosynthesis